MLNNIYLHRNSLRSSFVLVSLGSKRWTEQNIQSICSSAYSLGFRVSWYLLDIAESKNIEIFNNIDTKSADIMVQRHIIRMKSLLIRSGVKTSDIHVASSMSMDKVFSNFDSLLSNLYLENTYFSKSIRNQVFSNIQPILRRVGIHNNREPRIDKLAKYLIHELSLKSMLCRMGHSVEFTYQPQMKIWEDIVSGKFSELGALTNLSLEHIVVDFDQPSACLKIESLSFSWEGDSQSSVGPERHALNDISLVGTGIIAILGPSGSGKSTLLRAIAGHLPAQGKVQVKGCDLSAMPTERRNIVTVFQDYGLFPHLDGIQNVLEGGRRLLGIRKVDREWLARQYLRDIEVEHCASRLPRQMSGGEQQRIAIARALMAEPDLLLLDEPTAALDQIQRESLKNILKGLVASRPDLTILVVTHDLNFALSIADSIGVMDDGRLLKHCGPSNLVSRPGSLRVAQILGLHNIVPGTVLPDGHFVSASSTLKVRLVDGPEPGKWNALIPYESVRFGEQQKVGPHNGTLVEAIDLGLRARLKLKLDEEDFLFGLCDRSALMSNANVGETLNFEIDWSAVEFVLEQKKELEEYHG